MQVYFNVPLDCFSVPDGSCADLLLHPCSPCFYFTACLQFTSCSLCVESQINFNCSWCHRLNRWENKALDFHKSNAFLPEWQKCFSVDRSPWGSALKGGGNSYFTSTVRSCWSRDTLSPQAFTRSVQTQTNVHNIHKDLVFSYKYCIPFVYRYV